MTLEQMRAALAYRHVHALADRDKAEKDLYASMSQKLPVLIRAAGLCQALHFVQSREKTKPILGELLDHLAEQLHRTAPGITERNTLCAHARGAVLTQYLWMTREALASAEWYSRLSQSELGVPRGTGD